MDMSTNKPSKAGRLILGAVLLAALALVISAADTQIAIAQVDIEADNLISNGSFETGPAIPNGWLGDGALTPKDKRKCNEGYAGSCSFKFKGDSNQKAIYQCQATTTQAGAEFKVKVWTKSKSLVGAGEAGSFGVEFWNAGSQVSGGTHSLWGGTTPWTLRTLPITAPSAHDTVCIRLQIAADNGTMWFDKLTLVYLGGP